MYAAAAYAYACICPAPPASSGKNIAARGVSAAIPRCASTLARTASIFSQSAHVMGVDLQ